MAAERVSAAGADRLNAGKANLAEFAWGVLGANEWYGTVHNPAHPGRPAARCACPPPRATSSR